MYTDAKSFGRKFRSIRLDRGFSLDELSNVSSISKSTILDIEKGKRFVKIETLEILSYYMKVNMLDVLINSKDSKTEKLHTLISDFRNSLSNQDYSRIDSLRNQLLYLYDSSQYSATAINDVLFFNNLDISILWLEGVAFSISDQYDLAENKFIEALCINNNDFNLNRVHDFDYMILDFYVLNSLLANRTRSHRIDNIIPLLKSIIEEYEKFITKDISLLLILYNNLANHLLEQELYSDLIENMNLAINLSESYRVLEFFPIYKLFLALGEYLKMQHGELDDIKNAVIAIEVSGRESMAKRIRYNLIKKYGIEF